MKAVVQRVCEARVTVDAVTVGEIGPGLLVLVGVTHSDTPATAEALARKVYFLRILRDDTSVADTSGAAILVVSQFTLYGDVRKGRRPSWSAAARGEHARPLVDLVVAELRGLGAQVATGEFGADMLVRSVNDGPVTILVEI